MKHKERARLKQSEIPKTEHPAGSLEDLQHAELSGDEGKNLSLESSSTDENENEGLGDGNIGRSNRDILGK